MSKNIHYDIQRHPPSTNKSLRAWSAADEYLSDYIHELKIDNKRIGIFHDRFGFLSCHLHHLSPLAIIENKSQKKSILKNIEKNNLPTDSIYFKTPLEEIKINTGIIRIPKSLELFKLFLNQICIHSDDDVEVICSFMTRHFSPKILETSSLFFEAVEQSRAKKKSRLLILKNKKKDIQKIKISETITFENFDYFQYSGVFSSGKIDYATQFLLSFLKLNGDEKNILDLASGNGIIAHRISLINKKTEIHLLEDSFLALESSKKNLKGDRFHFNYNDNLALFPKNHFDLIVSNPPFHFEYEINISIPLHFFNETFACFTKGGYFQLVANRHLNYKTHLDKIFEEVSVLGENKKFIVYYCKK